ncbi:hydroxyacid dehydrogenase [Patescibacteria group bacterium]|nr:hydroxyacid dehydrogenase [Patescibacteria group bacterium]
MKIGFFESNNETEINFFKTRLSEHKLTFSNEPLTSENLPDDKSLEIAAIFVNCQVDKNVINSLPNLKAIIVRATGFDNVDIAFCKQKNIIVSNVPAYGSHTVAEFTFALMLNVTRKIYTAINRVKIGRIFSPEGLKGLDLFGKTLGVIGTGKIGTNVIKIAKGFGMNVLAFDAHPDQTMAGGLDFKYLTLEEVLRLSDIITIHVPYNNKTHHLLNSTNLPLIKKGSILINTSRGAVLETDTLFRLLSNGHLSGAGLDVLEEEDELKEEVELLSRNAIPEDKYKEILENHMLINMPQVIITPHMAFFTKEAIASIRKTTLENINAFIKGIPLNQVQG